MSGRTGETQTILNGVVGKKAECAKWMPKKMLQEQEQAVEPRQVVAPKRSYRPHTLRPSIIRRMCQLPPEKNNAKTQAKVMYFNSRFGKCSPAVCHEDICPYTEVCKKHKKIPKPSIAIMKHINRIVKKSARSSAMPKSKLNSPVPKNATKPPRTPGVYIHR